MEKTPPPFAQVLQLVLGKWVSGAVCALAKLGVPDHVDATPRSAEEIAAKVGAKEKKPGLVVIARTGGDGSQIRVPADDSANDDRKKLFEQAAAALEAAKAAAAAPAASGASAPAKGKDAGKDAPKDVAKK